MKPTTEKGFRDKIRKACEGVGTYKPEFEQVIWRLAGIYVRMQHARGEFERTGSKTFVAYTNKAGATNPAKNPYLQELDFLQKTALELEKELGLTPASLRKINEAAMLATPAEEDALSAALGALRIIG